MTQAELPNIPLYSYDQYLGFPNTQQQPWDPQIIGQHLRNLGAMDSDVSQFEADCIKWCYQQAPDNRVYHGPDHGGNMGQDFVPEPIRPLSLEQSDASMVSAYVPSQGRLSDRRTEAWAGASLAISGLYHDAAYKHVDALPDGSRAWPSVLADQIGAFVYYDRRVENGRDVFRTFIREEGKTDEVTQLVAHMFGVGADGIIHNQGGNEFDSALAAAKFLQSKGAPPDAILATVTEIAATIPFRTALGSAGEEPDGHMGMLARRLKDARLFGFQPDWQDVNDIMLLSVTLANRDISPFIQPNNLAAVIHNGRGVRSEESTLHKKRSPAGTIIDLVIQSRREGSAPLLYEWFGSGTGPVPVANVPHVYMMRDADGHPVSATDCVYPPLPVYQEAVRHAEINSRMSSLYFKANEAGIALVAALANLADEPDARVPGLVFSELWDPRVMPESEHIHAFNVEEAMLLDVMMRGTSQSKIDPATPAKSPIGGMLFGSLGTAGTEALAKHIRDLHAQAQADGAEHAFSDQSPGGKMRAQAFVHHVYRQVGPGNMLQIIQELQRVARFFADDPERGNSNRALRLFGVFLDTQNIG